MSFSFFFSNNDAVISIVNILAIYTNIIIDNIVVISIICSLFTLSCLCLRFFVHTC